MKLTVKLCEAEIVKNGGDAAGFADKVTAEVEERLLDEKGGSEPEEELEESAAEGGFDDDDDDDEMELALVSMMEGRS